MEKDSKIYVAGHSGLLGSAIVRKLEAEGYSDVITVSHGELDLTDQRAASAFFDRERPEYVFLAAAKVGGIQANAAAPASFFYENLMISANVIHAAYKNGAKKLLFFGSSCIYPRDCPQPIKEEYLLSDYLEKTNEGYALAKIAGLKMCAYYREQFGCGFISCMPTNLYGPGDNFNLESSHVLPALIRKFHEAKARGHRTVAIWGSGRPRREFMHVDDAADAGLFLMNNYDGGEHVNVGTGRDVSIHELAHMLQAESGYEGALVFDRSKPDGTPQKLLDVSKLNAMGWKSKIGLRDGVRQTMAWYAENAGGAAR
ncbi:MAG: GDP-L-fucose synthase [Clostridiales Family XIII bacterium]|jgi:GDP-L-fucose synthase|nr:GDP-L-fucose synthase [Clostridiales Family XIII bacterium]